MLHPGAVIHLFLFVFSPTFLLWQVFTLKLTHTHVHSLPCPPPIFLSFPVSFQFPNPIANPMPRASAMSRVALFPSTVARGRLVPLCLVLLLSCLLLIPAPAVSAILVGTTRSRAARLPLDLLTHVTFASCNRQHDDQSFWMRTIAPALAKENPSHTARTDLLLWLGNAVYADVDESGVALRVPRSPGGIAAEYKELTENDFYRQFVEEVVEAHNGRVAGVWDDRDLGMRFADANYSQSEAVRRIYLKQLWRGYPLAVKDSAGEGAHGALYAFTTVPAPEDSQLAKYFVNSVCTVTLDVRTQRSQLPNLVDALLRSTAEDGMRMHGTRGKKLDYQIEELRAAQAAVMRADLLGTAQWAWLEDVIRTYLAAAAQSPGDDAGRAHCAVTLIASPWQILLNDNKPFEGWDLYPSSRSKLLLLLKKYEVGRVLFLSGHTESGELGVVRRAAKADITLEGPTASFINSFPLKPLTKDAARLLPLLPSYLVEVTTGGLTHTIQDAPLAGRLAHWFTSLRTAEDEKSNGFVKRHLFLTRTTTLERNFGTLQLIGEGPATTAEARAALAAVTKPDVMRQTRLVLTLRSAVSGDPLISFNGTLEQLPSYAVQPLFDEVNETEEEETMALDLHDVVHLPVFNTLNIPGDIPWLKRRLAERQCAEVPCANGQYYVLVKVVGALTLAFVVLLLFIAGVYFYQLRYPNGFDDDASKPKQD